MRRRRPPGPRPRPFDPPDAARVAGAAVHGLRGRVTASLRAGLAALLLVPGLVGPAAADDLEHPLAHSRLSLVDGTKPRQRRIRFKARFAAGGAKQNPALAGASKRGRWRGPPP